MINIVLPENKERRLVFYLAMEEFAARHIKEFRTSEDKPAEVFFMWQVPPTVIFGRNQVMEAEVNIKYCREKNIRLFRRKSGGGCVYADWGNIMLSYISESVDVAATFESFLQKLASKLQALGLDAERSGRNDVLVAGKKVSGNAFFLLPKSSIVHGTLLFNSNFDELERAITPSEDKIKSKGVESVRQHVTNVKAELEKIGNSKYTDIEEFKKYILSSFCEGEQLLNQEQVEEILEIEQTYLDPDFFEGRKRSYSISKKSKIEGVGEMELELDMEGENISGLHLKGDFFPLRPDYESVLEDALKGAKLGKEDLEGRLAALELSGLIMNLNMEKMLDVLIR